MPRTHSPTDIPLHSFQVPLSTTARHSPGRLALPRGRVVSRYPVPAAASLPAKRWSLSGPVVTCPRQSARLPRLLSHGDEGTRTPDLCLAKAPLSRLSYVPLSVGLSRLERLTSRLSGECSNQLSYRPVQAARAQLTPGRGKQRPYWVSWLLTRFLSVLPLLRTDRSPGRSMLRIEPSQTAGLALNPSSVTGNFKV